MPAPVANAATLIVSYLEALGVSHVFGVPGGAIEPFYNAMAVSMRRGGLRPVVARHEAGAAFMADGYARETGKIGVCCATSGPGATNLITGVACAYDNNIPMLVITGHTDDTGTMALNMQLSQARADSVKQYLIAQQVNPIRLETRGVGPNYPGVPNTTDANRALNRRVEIHIEPITQ